MATIDEAAADKQKMRDYAERLKDVRVPVMGTEAGKTAVKNAAESLESVTRDMIFWSEDNFHGG